MVVVASPLAGGAVVALEAERVWFSVLKVLGRSEGAPCGRVFSEVVAAPVDNAVGSDSAFDAHVDETGAVAPTSAAIPAATICRYSELALLALLLLLLTTAGCRGAPAAAAAHSCFRSAHGSRRVARGHSARAPVRPAVAAARRACAYCCPPPRR